MKTHHNQTKMKHILTTTILAATALFAQADDRTIPEKVRDAAEAVVDKTKEVAIDTKDVIVTAAHDTKDATTRAARRANRATRAGWAKTKAYLSDEMPTYSEGANATLTNLAREIAETKAMTPNPTPVYFRTRLTSLDEQHELLTRLLSLLSPEQLKERNTGPRHDFDECVEDLEAAIDQAKDGADALTKFALK